MDDIHWAAVTSITHSAYGPYYDLTVPGAANYLAEGLWHHNSGKTRAGAEDLRTQHKVGTPPYALIGPTAADVRDVMVEGPAGIMAVCPDAERPTYEPTKRKLTFPNGFTCQLYSAEEPERLRGPQHGGAWFDELAAWSNPDATWDQAMFGMRLGNDPRIIVTTTPKPIPIVKRLLADPTTVVTRASTYANLANLAPQFADQIVKRYEGTRLGRQELLAEIVEDVEGALWQYSWIDAHRTRSEPADGFARIVVAVDPATTAKPESCETAIAVAGLGFDNHLYLLASVGLRASPQVWANAAVRLYRAHLADAIVCEVNNGGDMVIDTIRRVAPDAHVKKLHASRGKAVRAEPIAALYEQGRVHHVGAFADLEEQMRLFPVATDLQDRLDAMVWAMTELSGDAFAGVPRNRYMDPTRTERPTPGAFTPLTAPIAHAYHDEEDRIAARRDHLPRTLTVALGRSGRTATYIQAGRNRRRR